jgi:hypothetical protein
MENGELGTKKDLADLKADLKSEIRKDVIEAETRIVDRLTELIRDVETQLLTAFHGYGKGQAARMHLLEVADSTTSVRLAALEERVLNLETRRGSGSTN